MESVIIRSSPFYPEMAKLSCEPVGIVEGMQVRAVKPLVADESTPVEGHDEYLVRCGIDRESHHHD
jgi:hypothetical protein